MLARLRAADFTLDFVVETLVARKCLGDDARKTVLAREGVQRARIHRGHEHRGGSALTAPEVSPVELLASFQFPDPRRAHEVLDEDKITQILAEAVGLPYRKIDRLKLDTGFVTRTLSRPFARKHSVLPLEVQAGVLTVALANPLDRELIENLRALTRLDVTAVLSAPSDIQRSITEIYGFRHSVQDAQQQLTAGGPDVRNLEQFFDLGSPEALEAGSQPIVAAVDYLLHAAFEQRASDIHIEPRREESTIRFRIDGVLHPVHRVPRAVHDAMANRLKVMSRLDISSRKPQDGRIRTSSDETEMELRVATIPTAFGDKIVVRILDPGMLLRDVQDLGLFDDERAKFEQWLARPHGLILVTGPTGSGKTTTLYSALRALASPEVNVVTIEDPIEMIHEAFNQVQANAKTGTAFAEALRHVLRQDPDVIMVGEIRDRETADQAVQAALTGHLVLSTLHTNDCVGAVARLVDLGVPPFLVGSTLTGVVAQRLVRRVCSACGEDVLLTVDELAQLGVKHPEEYAGRLLARRGQGCAKCRFTGYFGRVGIFELLTLDRRLRQLVGEGVSPEALARAARQQGLRSLRDHAVRKVAIGATSLEEAMRATADVEVAS